MKKLILSIFLIICCLIPVTGQTAVEFLTMVDFYAQLEHLCEFVENQPDEIVAQVIQQQRVFLITGPIAAREIIVPEAENFVGEFEIVSGQWIGLEDVKMYRGFVQFYGPQFSNLIPAAGSRRSSPEEIPLNANVLIPVLLAGVREYEGVRVPVFEGIEIRILE